jgi:uncharacterized membrane protein
MNQRAGKFIEGLGFVLQNFEGIAWVVIIAIALVVLAGYGIYRLL